MHIENLPMYNFCPFPGIPETDENGYLFLNRYKLWGAGKCAGKVVHAVCVFGVGDLAVMASRPELIANKFHLDYEPLALDCMEELHYNRTKAQIQGHDDHHLNLTFYAEQTFVKNHV